MTRQVSFHADAWEPYPCWQSQDRKTLERINALIRDCQRAPFDGVGKPEPLKRQLSGCWSRRIDDTHRLVYRVVGNELQILACRYHHGAR
ncbi:MAG TPA: Txe/YoeB family addiction module toxin [Rhodanobacteraceae bacterium]